MLIYAIDNELFVHADRVVEEGRLTVVNVEHEVVENIELHRDNFFCLKLDIPTGKYLIRLTCAGAQIEKSVFIKRVANGS